MNSKLDQKKTRLKEESERFEDALSEEFSEFSDKLAELAKRVLIIGGGALISFMVVKMLMGKDKKQDKNENNNNQMPVYGSSRSAKSIFFRSLSDKAALILLEIAREMIVKYFNDIKVESPKDEG